MFYLGIEKQKFRAYHLKSNIFTWSEGNFELIQQPPEVSGSCKIVVLCFKLLSVSLLSVIKV